MHTPAAVLSATDLFGTPEANVGACSDACPDVSRFFLGNVMHGVAPCHSKIMLQRGLVLMRTIRLRRSILRDAAAMSVLMEWQFESGFQT